MTSACASDDPVHEGSEKGKQFKWEKTSNHAIGQRDPMDVCEHSKSRNRNRGHQRHPVATRKERGSNSSAELSDEDMEFMPARNVGTLDVSEHSNKGLSIQSCSSIPVPQRREYRVDLIGHDRNGSSQSRGCGILGGSFDKHKRSESNGGNASALIETSVPKDESTHSEDRTFVDDMHSLSQSSLSASSIPTADTPRNGFLTRVDSFRMGKREVKRTALEESLMQQLANMQALHDAELKEMSIKVEQRESAITTLERALYLRNETVDEIRDELDSTVAKLKEAQMTIKKLEAMLERERSASQRIARGQDRSRSPEKDCVHYGVEGFGSRRISPKRVTRGNHALTNASNNSETEKTRPSRELENFVISRSHLKVSRKERNHSMDHQSKSSRRLMISSSSDCSSTVHNCNTAQISENSNANQCWSGISHDQSHTHDRLCFDSSVPSLQYRMHPRKKSDILRRIAQRNRGDAHHWSDDDYDFDQSFPDP